MSNIIMGNLPTRLRDEDLLGFAPLEVVTIADLRRQRMSSIKALAGTVATVAIGYLLFRGAVEAKEQYAELEAVAAQES